MPRRKTEHGKSIMLPTHRFRLAPAGMGPVQVRVAIGGHAQSTVTGRSYQGDKLQGEKTEEEEEEEEDEEEEKIDTCF